MRLLRVVLAAVVAFLAGLPHAAAQIRADIEKWGRVVRAADIRAE